MKMRAKMRVAKIERHSEESETLKFHAVAKNEAYPEDGSDENNSFARWTPCADLTMLVNNPALIGKFTEGEEYYLDFVKAE
jgi:hypothetical protein